jgi:hypothetical protein
MGVTKTLTLKKERKKIGVLESDHKFLTRPYFRVYISVVMILEWKEGTIEPVLIHFAHEKKYKCTQNFS